MTALLVLYIGHTAGHVAGQAVGHVAGRVTGLLFLYRGHVAGLLVLYGGHLPLGDDGGYGRELSGGEVVRSGGGADPNAG